MKLLIWCLCGWLGGLSLGVAEWKLSLPGWQYAFPRDHYSHEGFKTEWWYFTGNLATADGRAFGYQLTFFRQGIRLPGAGSGDGASRFVTQDLKLAHFAISDLKNDKFNYAQKLSRGAYGEAGFSAGDRIAWIDTWDLRYAGEGTFLLRADQPDFALELRLSTAKPPVFHGQDGISRKAEGEGRASHYYSFTRLQAEGTVRLGEETFPVTGLSWYDHEWATNQLTENQVGWDWFSLQFTDGSELMLFQIRTRDGGRDPYSGGTFVPAEGAPVPVANADFQLEPTRFWQSPSTRGRYPVVWQLAISSLDLELEITTPLAQQELVLDPISYWEGAIRAKGRRAGTAVQGSGYLEMTGYAGGLVGLQAPEQ